MTSHDAGDERSHPNRLSRRTMLGIAATGAVAKPTIFQERSGDACDSLNRFQQDIDLVKALGFNSYRFSIEWARIEPDEGQFSIAMLDHYKRVIAYCHKAGIRPAVSFNH